MARWDPGAEDRLRKAALELFGEHGYDNVTVTQIAERAGLTRRSFSRHFTDKREVLFSGSEQLSAAASQAILAADKGISPLSAVLIALTQVGTQLVEYVDHTADRRAIIDASPELQERERTKLATITTAIREALKQRNVEPDHAELVAQIATTVFQNAFERWADARGQKDFASCLDAVVAMLRDTVAAAAEDEHATG